MLQQSIHDDDRQLTICLTTTRRIYDLKYRFRDGRKDDFMCCLTIFLDGGAKYLRTRYSLESNLGC